jgi:hypothetical protein
MKEMEKEKRVRNHMKMVGKRGENGEKLPFQTSSIKEMERGKRANNHRKKKNTKQEKRLGHAA